MQGPRIGAAIERHVVPDEDAPELRLDLEVEELEAGRAARLGFVEIDHRGPGPLPAVGLVFGPIGLVDVEEVGVLAEALALLVALALERFAVDLVDAEQARDRASTSTISGS